METNTSEGTLAEARVLVTGAGGFIGSHLCELVLSMGARLRAFVHYNSRNDWGMLEDLDPATLAEIEVISGDLRDAEAVRQAVRGCKVVFHLGALIGIPYSFRYPADVVATNINGTLNVLQACLESGVERLVQTSTSEVYGTAQFVPMDETHPLSPQSPYAATKIAADKLGESYHRSFGLPVVILRPFNTYGPRQSPRAVIPTIITQALGSRTVRLGNLTPRRDLTFVADTARGFVAAALAPGVEGETVQLGTQVETSIADVVKMVAALLGEELRVEEEARRRRPATGEVERLLASNRRAEELLGWKPEVSLKEGLERTIQWFRRRAENYKQNVYYV